MKKNLTLGLAALIFALTLSAFPHHAAATTITTTDPDSQLMRKSGDTPVKYLQVILATQTLMSALQP